MQKYRFVKQRVGNVDDKIGSDTYFCIICTLKIRTSIFRRILSSCSVVIYFRATETASTRAQIQYIPEVPYIISAKGKQTFVPFRSIVTNCTILVVLLSLQFQHFN